jgi:integrase
VPFGYDGELRARLYLMSYLTGLRRSELASLTPGSFQLAAEHPTLTVEAAFSKHRHKDILPLHPELTPLVAEWIVGKQPTDKLFPRLDRKKTWFVVKKDLARAGIEY